jgi:hypothetical protein
MLEKNGFLMQYLGIQRGHFAAFAIIALVGAMD